MKKGPASKTESCPIESPYGDFIATFSEKGLASLSFPKSRAKGKNSIPGSELASKTRSALLAVLNGEKPKQLPALDLQGTDFQKAVWKTLAAIPKGRTMTYGEIAQAIGRPKAFRAVGQACGANPVPVLIPCHRALAANRKIGGFSGGMEWKEKLLTIEQCEFQKPAAPSRG